MEERLPESVDVVIIGTGLPESILAAACARSGLTVLHLDRSEFYGGDWASFNLRTLEEWIGENERESVDKREGLDEKYASMLSEGETLMPLPNNQQITNIERQWTEESQQLTTVKVKGEEKEMTIKEAVESEWRRFSIDLTNKVLLSRGPMVQTLCDSEVAKYAEFKCIDRLLCIDDVTQSSLKFSHVPCSRSEIFESESITFVEKRRLMKFMQFCLEWNSKADEMEDWKVFADKPFVDFLQSQGIVGKPQSYIANTIGILQPNANTKEGLRAVCRFVDSVGRFGSSPFLSPLYGCGELPQCFCRLSAVFGGLYCLGRPIEAIIEKDNRVIGVIVDGQRVSLSHLILSPHFVPSQYGRQGDDYVDRTVLITKGSVLKEEKERITLLSLSELAPLSAPRLYEAGFECCTAPRGYYVVQITGKKTEEEYVEKIVDKLYTGGTDENAKLLYKLQYSMRSSSVVLSPSAPSNMAVLSPPDESLDYADVIQNAQDVFSRFWPDHDFLPRSLQKEEEEDEGESAEREREEEKQRVVEERVEVEKQTVVEKETEETEKNSE